MRSSQLAELAGVSTRTLRHYHDLGILPEPQRTQNGYRDYDATHLLRLLRIRQLASLGLSLEQIGPMIDMLDDKRANDEAADDACSPLDDLDRQLAIQIERLKHQRVLIARIRQGRTDPDYPERAIRALKAVDDFEHVANDPGFFARALAADDKIALGIAAHLYSDGELAEIERVFRAIPERGLTEEYLRVSRLLETLPHGAAPCEHEKVVTACMAFLEKIVDCFDLDNWSRSDNDFDRMLAHVAQRRYSDEQIALSNEILERFSTRWLSGRKDDGPAGSEPNRPGPRPRDPQPS